MSHSSVMLRIWSFTVPANISGWRNSNGMFNRFSIQSDLVMMALTEKLLFVLGFIFGNPGRVGRLAARKLVKLCMRVSYSKLPLILICAKSLSKFK